MKMILRLVALAAVLLGILAAPAMAMPTVWDGTYSQGANHMVFVIDSDDSFLNPDGTLPVLNVHGTVWTVTPSFQNVPIISYSCFGTKNGCVMGFNPSGGPGTNFGFLLANGESIQMLWIPGPLGFAGNHWRDSVTSPFALGGGAGPGTLTFKIRSTVPEPATWALTIAGFGMMGVALRRRRPAQVTA